jgi:hypothetical protein
MLSEKKFPSLTINFTGLFSVRLFIVTKLNFFLEFFWETNELRNFNGGRFFIRCYRKLTKKFPIIGKTNTSCYYIAKTPKQNIDLW